MSNHWRAPRRKPVKLDDVAATAFWIVFGFGALFGGMVASMLR